MMTMSEAMKEATHALLQRGPSIQTRDPIHPPPIHNLTNVYNTHTQAF